MEEKKVKMSLGTAICIIIIVILIAALIGMYIYFNKNAKNNEVAIDKTKTEAVSKEDLVGTYTSTFKDDFSKIVLKSDGTAEYDHTHGWGFEQTAGTYKYEDGKITYTREYYTSEGQKTNLYADENSYTVIFKVIDKDTLQIEYDSIEGDDTEKIKLYRGENYHQEGEGQTTIITEKYYVAESSSLIGTDLKKKMNYALDKCKIKFSDLVFTVNVYNFIIEGKYIYETYDGEDGIKLIIEETYLSDVSGDVGGGSSHENDNWFVKFKILDDKTIMVDDVYFGTGESEITICLHEAFVIGREYNLDEYNEKNVLGKWNSKYYYDENEDELSENLSAILGRSVQYGSYFEFLSDNKFKDYIHPVTEGDKYRNGTYTYYGAGTFSLTYDDGNSKPVIITVIDDNNLVYNDGNNKIILSK